MDTRVGAVIGGFLVLGFGVTVATDYATRLLDRRTHDARAVRSEPAPMPVFPVIDLARPGPLASLFAARPASPVVIPPPTTPAEPRRDASTIGACLFGGVVGAGTALMVGPAEIGALILGASLVPVTAPLVGMVMSGAFAAGCAGTTLLAPIVGAKR